MVTQNPSFILILDSFWKSGTNIYVKYSSKINWSEFLLLFYV